MKGCSRAVVPVVAIVVLLMVILSYTDARPLLQETSRDTGKEASVIGMSNSKTMTTTTAMMKDQTTSDSREDAAFTHLMGVVEPSVDDGEDEEGCGREHGNGEDEEECRMKRRMMADAHLDYIYTQHHSHP